MSHTTTLAHGVKLSLMLPVPTKNHGRLQNQRYFDASHFVLDENADAIAEAIIEAFSR